MLLRLWLLAAVFALLGVAFCARLFQLQVMHGASHARAVERATIVHVTLPPQRGRILDRNGTAMADTRPVYHLALILADLDLTGRARREVPLWQLDAGGFDGLVADLAGRLRWSDRARPLRTLVDGMLLAHPGVAIRSLPRLASSVNQPGSLLAIARSAFAAGDEDAAAVAGSDLVEDDPARAVARELSQRWAEPVIVLDRTQFMAVGQALDDRQAGLGAALDPFATPWQVTVPWTAPAGAAGPSSKPLDLRVITDQRRVQAVQVIARSANCDVQAAAVLLDDALRAAPAPFPSAYTYAAGSYGEQLAALLPPGVQALPVPLGEPPGERERVLIIQGDGPEGDGLGTTLFRRLADALGTQPTIIAGLVERHGRRTTPAVCERSFGVRQAVIDPESLRRLTSGLSRILTTHGRPTTVLDIEAAVAQVRRIVDRGWAGQGANDAIVAIRELPHEAAIVLAGSDAQPPDALKSAFDLDEPALPGVILKIDVGRTWPVPGSASHVLGMVGRRTVEEGRYDTLIGRSGLERTYDAQLGGVAGVETRMRTPDGVRIIHREGAQAGADMRTELDFELQMLTEDSLIRRIELAKAIGTYTDKMLAAEPVGRQRAGFVLMDIHTGGLLVLASTPTIPVEDMPGLTTAVGQLEAQRRASTDPAERARLRTEARIQGIPLHDYAAEADQPPGSSFKIITALCALEQGALQPGEIITCPGYMVMVGGKKILKDHAHGDFDLQHAIAVSSNVYFAKVGDRISKKYGSDFLPNWSIKVGLGGANALDVDQQKARFPGDRRAGMLPTPATLTQFRSDEPSWLPSDTWRMAIGQFCTASPLQVVAIAAAVGNGGRVVRPFLVTPPGQPSVTDLSIQAAWIAEVRHGMERVTEQGGTARALNLEGAAAGIQVAAKTGTSEWGSEESRKQPSDPSKSWTPDHAWMIGYAPADRPTVAFACFIHSGTFGGQACTPIVKRVLERYFAKYGRQGHAAGPLEAGDRAP